MNNTIEITTAAGEDIEVRYTDYPQDNPGLLIQEDIGGDEMAWQPAWLDGKCLNGRELSEAETARLREFIANNVEDLDVIPAVNVLRVVDAPKGAHAVKIEHKTNDIICEAWVDAEEWEADEGLLSTVYPPTA